MKIIVSACLAGDNCKYNGGNNFNKKMMEFSQVTKTPVTDFLQSFALRLVIRFWMLRNILDFSRNIIIMYFNRNAFRLNTFRLK